MSDVHAFEVPSDADRQRLDRFLVPRFPEQSRSRIAAWIGAGHVSVDGQATRPGVKLHAGQRVEVHVPAPAPTTIVPQPMELELVYEDDELCVVDKPAGLIVHPGAGHPDGTLVNGLMHRFGALSPIGAPERPGVVHRIDAGTSGLLVVARTERAHKHLAAQFAAHSAERRYLALAWDKEQLEETGTAETPYGRDAKDRRKFTSKFGPKRAVTHWTVLRRLPPCSWLELRLETGRTHQIRVHMADLGHALVGDRTYGGRRKIQRPQALRRLGFDLGMGRQALHAATLGFEHPDGRRLSFTSPVPADIQAALDHLEALWA